MVLGTLRLIGVVAAVLVLGCSTNPGPTAPPGPQTVAQFEGSFNVRTGELTLDVKPGPLRQAITLNYGTGANQVYFHTLPGSVMWNNMTGVLSGRVTAVNNYGVSISSLTAHIDSISATGASSNLPIDYGTVASQTESGDIEWRITNPLLGDFTFSGHAEGTLASGLVHCWGGENNGTDVIGGNNAAVGGAVSYTAGKSGQAFTFSGSTIAAQNIIVGAKPSVSSTGPWTYEFWIKRTSTNQYIIDRTPEGQPLVNLQEAGGGNLRWLVRNDSGSALNFTTSATVVGGTWTHLAITRGGGFFRVYQNGNELGSLSDAAYGALTPDRPIFGSHINGMNGSFVGQFDSFRIWNRALSQAELANIVAGDGSCFASP